MKDKVKEAAIYITLATALFAIGGFIAYLATELSKP